MSLFSKIQASLTATAIAQSEPPVPAIQQATPVALPAEPQPAADKVIDIDQRDAFIRRLNTAGYDGHAQIEAYKEMADAGMNTVTLYAAVKEMYRYTAEEAIAKYGTVEEGIFRTAKEWRALSKQKRFIKSHAAEA